MLRLITGVVLAGSLLIGCSGDHTESKSKEAGVITASGSTFAYPVVSKWAEKYYTNTQVQINYQATGSGAGIRQIQERIVDFAATDTPLTTNDLAKNQLVQFPLVLGGIAIVANLDGIKSGAVALDGTTLARIFSSDITTWNDPAIVKLNPTVNLPTLPITIVHRSDGSGTTYNFTDYLSKVSPDWQKNIGLGTMVHWKAGVGAKGNAGIAAYVARVPGAIGYVEYAYAKQEGLSWLALYNRDGKIVAPHQDSFAAAAANAKWQQTPDFDLLLTDQPGANSWPITATVFILLPKVIDDEKKANLMLAFFDWLYREGQPIATQLDYVPLPANVYALVADHWAKTLQNAAGKLLWAPNQAATANSSSSSTPSSHP